MKILKLRKLSIALIAFILLLAGCSSQLSASDLINKAMKASEKLDSYQFEGKVDLSIKSDQANAEFNPLQMFNRISVEYDGVYQHEPMQVEVNLDVSLGQPGLSLDIPIVMTENKLWLQVPALPIPLIPQEMVGKYIEIDMEELQDDPMLDEMPISDSSQLDFETQHKLGMEVLNIFMKHYDEDEFFSVMDADEADLPDHVEAEHLIRFSIADDQVEEVASLFVTGVLPDIYRLFLEPEWTEKLQLSKKDLDEIEGLIKESEESQEKLLSEFFEEMKLHKIQIENAINKDDYINYTMFDISVDVKDEDTNSWTSLALRLENHLKNINKEQQFEHGIPSKEDTLTYEELIPMFIGPSF